MGYLEYVEEMEYASSIHFTIERDELYKIREGSRDAEKLLTAILRNYCGLFSEQVYIDEHLLSKLTGISRHRIYEILVSLSQRRIIQYRPSKKTPIITFTRRRVLAEELRFEKEIYDDRKASFEERINYVIKYAQSSEECRSRMLLAYFGEKEGNDCGECDICKKKNHGSGNTNIQHETAVAIMTFLSDGTPRTVEEFDTLHLSRQKLNEALRMLADEEKIETINGKIKIKI
jgi:ATP-dependent DNA helicase RecQ